AIWEELQTNIYTEIPSVKVGDAAEAAYYSEQTGGWSPTVERGVPYWNLWLKDAYGPSTAGRDRTRRPRACPGSTSAPRMTHPADGQGPLAVGQVRYPRH